MCKAAVITELKGTKHHETEPQRDGAAGALLRGWPRLAEQQMHTQFPNDRTFMP